MCQSLLNCWRHTSELRFLTEQVSKSFSMVRKHQVLRGLKFIHLGGPSLTKWMQNYKCKPRYKIFISNETSQFTHITKLMDSKKKKDKIQRKLQSIFTNLLFSACFLAELSSITSSYDNLLTFSVRRIGR